MLIIISCLYFLPCYKNFTGKEKKGIKVGRSHDNLETVSGRSQVH